MQEIKSEQEQEQEHNNFDEVDENSAILLDEHIKIFDPDTNEVLVNKRGEE